MNPPDVLYAGDTLEFTTAVPDFPPADGWSLNYAFVPRFTTPPMAPVLIGATVVGDSYYVLAGPSQTAGWVPGAYGWSRWVSKAGARVTLDDLDSSGQLDVRQNPATAVQGFDNRSPARQALEAARAALANFTATQGRVKRYSIAGRSMEFETTADFVKLINYWEIEVNREERAKARAAGQANPRLIYTRAGRG